MAESIWKRIPWPDWRNYTNYSNWRNYSLSDDVKQEEAIGKELIDIVLYSRRLLGEHVDALEEWQAAAATAAAASSMKLSDDALHPLQQNERRYSMDEIIPPYPNSEIEEKSQKTNNDFLNWKNGSCLLGCSLLESLIRLRFHGQRNSLYTSLLLTGSFSIMYMVKQIFRIRNRMVAKELHRLIATIAEFSNCMNRNMAYFDAILNMKQEELVATRHINRVWDCITAATIVTEILFDATRNLEESYPLPGHFSQYYEPMEDIRKSKYFNDPVSTYTSKHIKDFHNIYIYVQSQYLLRLALTISQRPSLSKLNTEIAKLRSLLERWVTEEENHFKNLTIQERRKTPMNINLVAGKSNKYRTLSVRRINPVEMMQDTSMKLNARMMIVANQCYDLDYTLHQMITNEAKNRDNTHTLTNVSNHMNNIESTLTLCYEDFQHLMLVYNKYLNSQRGMNLNDDTLMANRQDEGVSNNNTDDDDDDNESILRVEISQKSSQNNGQQHDDFYAYMYDQRMEEMIDTQQMNSGEEEKKHEIASAENKLLNFEKRLSKRRFEPVLKQLKVRIDPIREKMLQREREILAAKGFDINEFANNCQVKKLETSMDDIRGSQSDSSCSSTNEYERFNRLKCRENRLHRSKSKVSHDNYEEIRKLLIEKDNNLLPFQLPEMTINLLGSEDIVESNC